MEELDAVSLHRGQAIELEPIHGQLERSVRHVHADNARELAVVQQESQQPSLTAAEVQDRCRTAPAERSQDCREALLVQTYRLFERGLFRVLLRGAADLVGTILFFL